MGFYLDLVPGYETAAQPVDPDEEWERQAAHNRAVTDEVERLRVREDATRRLRAERASALPTPALLSDFLDIPDPEQRYRVDRLWPAGGRIVLAAQYKAGKTTTVGNLLRSLADGVPFLGAFDVEAPEGRIVLFDDELDEAMLRRWLRDQGVQRPDRVAVVSLRGRIASLDLIDDHTRARWAKLLRDLDAAVVILDCLRPALDALGLSEDKEAGRFLVAFDALLVEAGVREAVVTHHMGHGAERARGASQLRDWPDAEWRLVREKDDDGEHSPDARRYLTAYGRDVDVPESLLGYDATTRRLSVAGGSRKDAAADVAIPDVLEYLRENPGSSGRQIEAALGPMHKRETIRKAVIRAVESGRVETMEGPRRAVLHTLSASSAPSAPSVRQRSSGECASALIESAHHSLAPEPSAPRRTDVASETIATPRGSFYDLFDGVPDSPPCRVCGMSADPVLGEHGEVTHPWCA